MFNILNTVEHNLESVHCTLCNVFIEEQCYCVCLFVCLSSWRHGLWIQSTLTFPPSEIAPIRGSAPFLKIPQICLSAFSPILPAFFWKKELLSRISIKRETVLQTFSSWASVPDFHWIPTSSVFFLSSKNIIFQTFIRPTKGGCKYIEDARVQGGSP